MARGRFPENSLTAGETIERHLRPHWRTLVVPAVWAVGILVTLVAGLIALPGGVFGDVLRIMLTLGALLLFVLFAGWPALVSRTTHIVLTNKRLLLREGVGHVEKRDIPLVLLEVKIKQSLIDRILGTGTLVIAAAGQEQELKHVPDVVQTEVRINALIHDTGHERGADVPDLEKRLLDTKDRGAAAG